MGKFSVQDGFSMGGKVVVLWVGRIGRIGREGAMVGDGEGYYGWGGVDKEWKGLSEDGVQASTMLPSQPRVSWPISKGTPLAGGKVNMWSPLSPWLSHSPPVGAHIIDCLPICSREGEIWGGEQKKGERQIIFLLLLRKLRLCKIFQQMSLPWNLAHLEIHIYKWKTIYSNFSGTTLMLFSNVMLSMHLGYVFLWQGCVWEQIEDKSLKLNLPTDWWTQRDWMASRKCENVPISTIKWLSAEKQNLNNFPFRIVDAFSLQSTKFMEFRNQILQDSNAQILLFAWKAQILRKTFLSWGLP